ncbi:MAG: exodeoxyribonuclease VII small subunit, partial [Candidatus Nanopelagicales bacterium]
MTRKGDSTGKVDAAADVISYEEARAELADIVAALESGNATLEESLALWERGETLAQACLAW